MIPVASSIERTAVALRKESVDRNRVYQLRSGRRVCVALRKESVDRNSRSSRGSVPELVALRKESVDRNSVAFVFGFGAKRRSPQGERG